MEVRKKVLIIDDEVDTCLLLSNYFTKHGCDVTCSNSLSEGLQLLDVVNPDIIFLDNNLPDGFGWEVTSFILNKKPTADLHLITAYNNSMFDSKKAADKVRLWQKPISFKKLDEILKKKNASK